MQIRFYSAIKQVLWIGLVLFLAIMIVVPTFVSSVDPAPDFTVPTTSGEVFHLQENRSEPVVIEFMTPTCEGCKKVEDHLKELYPDYKDDFTFLSIDINDNNMSVLRDHKQDRGVPWEIGRGDSSLAVDKYSISTVPTVMIVDKGGYLTFKKKSFIGDELTKGEIEREMKAVLEGEAERIDLQQYGIYTLAIIGGVASFFSPCSFPMLPSYIAYYIRPEEDEGGDEEKNLGLKGLSLGGQAAAGIVAVFGIVGAIAVSGGRWISTYIPYLKLVVGGLILLLGTLLLADIDIGTHLKLLSYKIKRRLGMDTSTTSGTSSSPFFYGLGYGSSAASCTAPVFIAVVLSSWLSGGLSEAAIVLVLYLSIIAVLMIVFSVLTVYFREKIMEKMQGAVRCINLASGLILVAAGIYLLYQFAISL